jgi:hypothetical protein
MTSEEMTNNKAAFVFMIAPVLVERAETFYVNQSSTQQSEKRNR